MHAYSRLLKDAAQPSSTEMMGTVLTWFVLLWLRSHKVEHKLCQQNHCAMLRHLSVVHYRKFFLNITNDNKLKCNCSFETLHVKCNISAEQTW